MMQETCSLAFDESELEMLAIVNGYLASQKISTMKSNGRTNRSLLIREALRLAVEAISSKTGKKKLPKKALVPAPHSFPTPTRVHWNRRGAGSNDIPNSQQDE